MRGKDEKRERGLVIITGGAQRLGLYNAERLVEAGYSVLVTYRRKRENIEEIEAKGIDTLQADFSREEGIDRFISRIKDTYSSLRAVVHNASLWYSDEMINEEEEGYGHFMDLVHVHMLAPYKINYGLRPLLEASAGSLAGSRGRQGESTSQGEERAAADIVHMTDFVVDKGSRRHAAYAATKAALENMTLSFAAAFGPTIKVNSIAPALVKFNTWDSEEYRKKAAVKSIMGFEPGEDVAFQALDYLLHNPYVTGNCLHIDGGRHLV